MGSPTPAPPPAAPPDTPAKKPGAELTEREWLA